jgi:hypothetical protein
LRRTATAAGTRRKIEGWSGFDRASARFSFGQASAQY